MIAVDTNVLVHAHRHETPRHSLAEAAVLDPAESSSRWAILVFCLGEFKRVVTHPRLFNPQHSTDEACLAVRRPIVFPSRAVLCPDPDRPALLMEAAQEANAVGNRAFDAQTVAVCREHRLARLMTEDRDLDRFAGLETKRLAD